MAFDSELRLYRHIPLDPRYEHTLLWGNRAEQEAFFSASYNAGQYFVGQFTDFKYLRKNASVSVSYDAETLEDLGVNYLAMRNDGKWRYYFVLDKVYKSPSCTELVVELDVMQTYQFDWDIPACFVEREHVTDDTIGVNLLDEGLELGEYVMNIGTTTEGIEELAIIIQSSVSLVSATGVEVGDDVQGEIIGGVYSGFPLYCVRANSDGVNALHVTLDRLDLLGKTDGIQSMWMYPSGLLDVQWATEGEYVYKVRGLMKQDIVGARAGSVNTYVPRNKKLLTFPYCFVYAYNNMGQGAQYRYELFTDGSPHFSIGGNIANDGIVRLVPRNYRNYNYDNESGLSLSGYPTCAWSQDLYKIWMAQNSNTQALAIQSGEWTTGMGAVQTAAGLIDLVTMEGIGTTMAGIDKIHSGQMQIESVMAQRSDVMVQPPQAKGTQSGCTNISLGIQTFTLVNYSIGYGFAKRIDAYFDMYGYRVNEVKEPNLNTRQLWNYVKTISCVVLGNIDTSDRRKIGAIFDKGITLWHNPMSMYRYDHAAGNVNK